VVKHCWSPVVKAEMVLVVKGAQLLFQVCLAQ
jgi:hypothetical protein